jgi:hypothetical protein
MAPPVLLVDFSVFNPSADLRVNFAWHRKHSLQTWKVRRSGDGGDGGAILSFLWVGGFFRRT